MDATKKNPSKQDGNMWERIGLHRQINSFFLQLVYNLGLKMPHVFITVAIYARFIQPFPMVSGSVSWASSIFGSLFLILDMGTGVALSKFFAAHRIKNPAKALKYVQVYAWWQILITSVQASIVVMLGIFIFPHTAQAGTMQFLVLASITRLPGCFGVVGMVLNAMQRFDIKIKLDAILGTLVNTLISYLLILSCRAIFAALPQYGEAFGAGIGIFAGSFICGFVNFIIFAIIYKRLGYSLKNLFRVEFSRVELKEVLSFGSKLTLGNGFYGLTSFIQTLLISIFVFNYNEELGVYHHVGNLTQYVGLILTFSNGLIPAISEADNHQKKKLLEYYLVAGLKYSYFIMFFLAAIFYSIGGDFLTVSGEQWIGSLKYAGYYIFFSCWFPLAWYVDSVFQGTGHPGYNTIVWYVEQGTRLTLLIILLPRFQLFGLIFSYIPGIIMKGIVAITIIRKKILAFKPYWMQTFIASALSAVVVYLIFKGINTLLGEKHELVTILLFLLGILGGLVVHGFLTGFLGGWDDNTAREFADGISLTRTTSILFGPLVRAVEKGHQFCPWKNRFPVDIFERAYEESKALTAEKVKLSI